MSSQASSWHMLDPAHDPERRSPRATRGSDENFHRPELSGSNSGSGRTRDLVSGGTSNDDTTEQSDGDYLYPWHKPETVLDRLEEAMNSEPLPYKPKAVNISDTPSNTDTDTRTDDINQNIG